MSKIEGKTMNGLEKLIRGLEIINATSRLSKQYDFQHGVMYVGNINNCTDDEIKELEELGFHVDEDNESFCTYS